MSIRFADRTVFPIACTLLSLVTMVAHAGCTSGDRVSPPPVTATEATAPATTEGPRVHFSYVTLSGEPLSTESLAGRISVIGFAATYDVASQAEARFLSGLLHRHSPRINVALLVLE